MRKDKRLPKDFATASQNNSFVKNSSVTGQILTQILILTASVYKYALIKLKSKFEQKTIMK